MMESMEMKQLELMVDTEVGVACCVENSGHLVEQGRNGEPPGIQLLLDPSSISSPRPF